MGASDSWNRQALSRPVQGLLEFSDLFWDVESFYKFGGGGIKNLIFLSFLYRKLK